MAFSRKRKSSDLWQFFKEVDENFALCNMCKQKLSYKTSTSNLKKHLKCKHPTVALPESSGQQSVPPVIVQENEDNPPGPSNQPSVSSQESLPISSTRTTGQASLSQANITSYSGFRKICAKSKESINRKFLLLFIKDFQPFSIVEDDGFKNFVSALNPGYELPNRHTISKTLLPALYEECLSDTRKDILTGKSFCITTDSWTSNSTVNYIGVTAHFLDESFEFHSLLLECSKMNASHKSEDISVELKRISQHWGIENKIILAVSDNASNMQKAILQLLEWKHFGCFAHTSNLIVKDALKTTDIQTIIEKVKKLVEHFRRSCVATEKLSTYQMTSRNTPLKLIQETPTRWNSTFYMIERFINLEEALKSTLAVLEKDLPKLTPEERKILQELCHILKPYENVTKVVSGENYCTAALVIPVCNGLRTVHQKLTKFKFSCPVMEVLKHLQDSFEKRLGNVENSNTLSLATFLDPRFKQIAFQFFADDVKKRVINLLAQKISEGSCEKSTECQEETPEVHDELSIWVDFDKTVASAQPQGTFKSRSIIEVQRFLEDDILPRNKDPLQWWNEHKLVYPNLARLAQERLCALASSVPCERVFSKAGLVLTDRRNRLKESKVNMLLFLNANYH